MNKITIDQLDGGEALCEWFGDVPSFHDATLTDLELRQGAAGRLVLRTFEMQSETDEKGYFQLRKHVAVTLTIVGLIAVELSDFMEAGIIFSLDIESENDEMTLRLDSSYGVHGSIKARKIAVSFQPVDPDT